MTDSKYLNSSQQRILGLLRCLAGNEIEGLAPGDIAKLNGCSAPDVTRDLDNLKHAGLAEQLPTTGRYRLGPFGPGTPPFGVEYDEYRLALRSRRSKSRSCPRIRPRLPFRRRIFQNQPRQRRPA